MEEGQKGMHKRTARQMDGKEDGKKEGKETKDKGREEERDRGSVVGKKGARE